MTLAVVEALSNAKPKTKSISLQHRICHCSAEVSGKKLTPLRQPQKLPYWRRVGGGGLTPWKCFTGLDDKGSSMGLFCRFIILGHRGAAQHGGECGG